MLRHTSDIRMRTQRKHTDQAAGLRALMTPVLPQVRVVVAACFVARKGRSSGRDWMCETKLAPTRFWHREEKQAGE